MNTHTQRERGGAVMGRFACWLFSLLLLAACGPVEEKGGTKAREDDSGQVNANAGPQENEETQQQPPATVATIATIIMDSTNWSEYTSPIEGGGAGDLRISSEVWRIADDTFAAQPLDSIDIPDSVLFIGARAFKGSQLKSVRMGNGVLGIGFQAFQDNELHNLEIPDSVQFIGISAFERGFKTPSSQDPRLMNETDIHSLTIGDGISRIEARTFANNALGYLTIGNNVAYIGEESFSTNELFGVLIPDSVITIASRAFMDGLAKRSIAQKFSESLDHTVTIGTGVVTIEESAFELRVPNEKGMRYLILGPKVESIGKQAFKNHLLFEVDFRGTAIKSIGSAAFYDNYIGSIPASPSSRYELYLPDSITTILASAFKDQNGNEFNVSYSSRLSQASIKAAFPDDSRKHHFIPRS